MCPGTLALVGLGASAGGSVLGGISGANSAAYSAQVARQNAIIEQQDAARAAMATSSQATQAGLKARAQDSAVRAAGAANNLDVNSGSPADVETSQREIGNLDVSNTAERGAEATYGYEAGAVSQQAQAALDQSQVVPDILGGVLKGGGSLLSGASNLPSTFSWMGAPDATGTGDFGGSGVDILDG
jgi:hypothetical protein